MSRDVVNYFLDSLSTRPTLGGAQQSFVDQQYSSYNSLVVTFEQLTAGQNNFFLPTGGLLFRFTTDASRTITGFANVAAARLAVILNTGAQDLVLAHQSASSTANNRIISPTGANYTLTASAYEAAILIYDSVTARWQLIAGTGS